MKPVIKWQGGKTQLLSEIKQRMPSSFNNYYEPFVGGGAVLLELAPNSAVINDFNGHLTTLYNVFKKTPIEFADFKNELKLLETQFNNLSTHQDRLNLYIQHRNKDKNPSVFGVMNDIDKTVRFIFLNKTAFNGRYRENSKGEFNVPYGGYEKTTLVNTNLDDVYNYFTSNNIIIMNGDFQPALAGIQAGDFIYMDPPYDPIVPSELNYTSAGFSAEDQKRVKQAMDNATNKKAYCMASNHRTDFIDNLYKGYRIEVVKARRSINVKGDKRGPVDEVLIMNYDVNGNFLKSTYVEKDYEKEENK
jgi:DNA adenine methylase